MLTVLWKRMSNLGIEVFFRLERNFAILRYFCRQLCRLSDFAIWQMSDPIPGLSHDY